MGRVPSLAVGAVDPDTYLPKMLEKLKTVGANKIMEDKQAQLDKFMAEKKSYYAKKISKRKLPFYYGRFLLLILLILFFRAVFPIR